MHIKEQGKLIEVRIREAVLRPEVKKVIGDRPSIFPDRVVVKQRQEDGTDKLVTYLPK